MLLQKQQYSPSDIFFLDNPLTQSSCCNYLDVSRCWVYSYKWKALYMKLPGIKVMSWLMITNKDKVVSQRPYSNDALS